MVADMRRVAVLLLPGLLLGACHKAAQNDLAAQILFTANGSYDASADQRTREGQGMRRVSWQTKSPLPAQSVTVDYDSDARTLAWAMTVVDPKFTASEVTASTLTAGQTAQPVQTKSVNTVLGRGTLIQSGRLKEVLFVPVAGGLRLVTFGYASQHQTELLPAFKP